ncbi:MAG: B12-binding domain-containing radical SAM protein [Desulfovibrio sp.]|nr:B12-binding domain-containing radical SAM protein [Desulfovibrio sp.]
MYDLLLINTHRQRDFDGGGYADWLGVRLLASYIEDCGYSARVFSGFTHECVEILREELPRGVKVVGFACDYDNWREVMNLAKMIKEEYGVPVIVGGHQAIALDKDFLEKSGVLAIVRGEGEIPLHGLMQYLIDGAGSLADIPGLTYLEDGAEKRTPSPPPIENLDALPFIDPSLCLDSHFRDRYATVITARGCPFQCAFCYEGGNTRRVRWRSVDNVMAELKEMLASTPELRFALFVDDTFTLNKKRIAEFCDKLRVYREERDFCWFAEAHASTILKHPEIIPMMVDAGLASLQIGVESGSERVLRGYNKKTTPQMLKEAVAICKEASVVHVPANIIVGGAFETRETIEE